MPEKLTSTNISPEDTPLPDFIRWCKIHVGGKVLHTLVGGGKSLSDTFQGFLKTTGIGVDIDEGSDQAIKDFCKNDSGVMTLDEHPNNNFSDYIPLLAQIPEEVLEKTTFFAGKHTVPMFKKEFGEKYKFIAATFDSISEVKQGLQELEKAIEKVDAGDGYIFIIPGGAESEDSKTHQSFKGLFLRMAKELPIETPLLKSKVTYGNPVSYGEVYKRAGIGRIKEFIEDEGREGKTITREDGSGSSLQATLTCKNITTGDFNKGLE